MLLLFSILIVYVFVKFVFPTLRSNVSPTRNVVLQSANLTPTNNGILPNNDSLPFLPPLPLDAPPAKLTNPPPIIGQPPTPDQLKEMTELYAVLNSMTTHVPHDQSLPVQIIQKHKKITLLYEIH